MSKLLSRAFLPCAGALLLALAPAALAAQAPLPPWAQADPAARTLVLDLEVTHPAGAPSALLNGEANGALQVVVPRGWTVRWNWVNHDSAGPHSLVVMAEREKLPMEGGRPAFTNAMTRALVAGLATDRTDVTTFEAEEDGWYWILCGVSGHAIAGEYLGLRVDPAATVPAVKRKGEP